MHRSDNRRRLFTLLLWPLRPALSWGAILLLFVHMGSALAQGVVVPAENVSVERAEATAKSALHAVNELANRRRLTTFFVNEQSPFYGVQVNYVSAGRGNLTFLNRDLVRLDRIPIVAGRIYDSRLEAESDFGPDWKLSVAEVIRHRGNTLRYVDASGSVYELDLEGTRIVSRFPHLTGIVGGRRQSGDIELRTPSFSKVFTNIQGDFYLSTVSDRFGNSLRLRYSGTRISRISSQNGRFVDLVRDTSGRIVSMRDDAERTVDYRYDLSGRLYSVRGMDGEQWRYRYDASGHLQSAIDPRGIDALTAGYAQEGRVSNVRVLYDVMSFSYQGSTTTVRNGLQQAATFWHGPSGLTTTVQDFEGSTTQVAFDNALRPASLSFNGSVVAELRYGQDGKVQSVLSSVEGRPRVSRFSYDGTGRLSAVVADDQQIARYAYDSAGRVLSAEDARGPRSYEYFGATGYQVNVGETELDIETNRLGLMKGFSNGHQSVGVSYSPLDQVRKLDYLEYGKVYTGSYDYGTSGLRSSGSYTKTGQSAPANLSLDYDVVGNLTHVDFEAPSGERSSQVYVLGMNNQLTRLMSPKRPDLVFEYDDMGRPTRRTLGTGDISHSFDALGRITAVYEGNRKMLEWRYGPMDVDAATEADDHTPWTAINEPIASAIFGSPESIAYARTRGTPLGPIRFSAPMARFVLATQLVPSADGVTLVSLQRRNVPLSSDHHANVSPGPMEFDKPSNALFLPPEFSSLNCYACVGRFEGPGAYMTINGSTGTPTVAVGASSTIAVNGLTTQCKGDFWYDQYVLWTEAGETAHYFDYYGDGNWSYTGLSGGLVSKTVNHTYSIPGLYTARAEVTCGCYQGGMWWDVLGAQSNVQVCDPEDAAYDDAVARFWGPRFLGTRQLYGFNANHATNTFSFSTQPGSPTSPELESDVAASHAFWNIMKSNACGTTYRITAGHQWVSSGWNLVYETATSLTDQQGNPLCGKRSAFPENPDLDRIQVLTNLGGTTCGPRPELLAHELGHLLGFDDSGSTFTSDIMKAPRAGITRSVEVHHAQTLLHYY